MSKVVQSFLEQKEGDFSQYVPASYNLNSQERRLSNTYFVEAAKFGNSLAARCIGPCFKYLQTPVITDEESECFTNCISKGQELVALYEQHLAKKHF